MAKLCAVFITSLRLFQSRLPLNFNEFVPNLCDLAAGSSHSIFILRSYSTTILVKRPHIYILKWLIILYISIVHHSNIHFITYRFPVSLHCIQQRLYIIWTSFAYHLLQIHAILPRLLISKVLLGFIYWLPWIT